MAKAKRCDGSPKIIVEDWAPDDVSQMFDRIMGDALEGTLEESPPKVEVPLFDAENPYPPTTLTVFLPFGLTEDGIGFDFTVTEVIEEDLGFYDFPLHPSDARKWEMMAEEFRRLADLITAKLRGPAKD